MSRTIATLFYVGLLRPAPGTWGSLAAVALAIILHGIGSFPLLAAATLISIPVGYLATRAATAGAADHDPSEIVIDELAGQFIALLPISFAMWRLNSQSWEMPWLFVAIAFALFRLFDIVKPGPVGWADRRQDAMGVMLDDIVAGILAAAIIIVGLQYQHLITGWIEWLAWRL